MDELEEMKERLAECDDQLISLLAERFAMTEKIIACRKNHDISVMQPQQEADCRLAVKKKLENHTYEKELWEVYEKILGQSKKVQAKSLFSYNIVLIGFMGAGKSTVSDCLSSVFAMRVVEMDQIIAEREGMEIPKIFETYGEEYFRNLETQLLIEMQSQHNMVISCGGGVAMRERNVREMKKNGRVVLLTARPETILDRVKDSDGRPLLNGNKNVDFITELMEKRREKYFAAADVVVETDQKSVLEICGELVDQLLALDEK